MFFVVNKNDLHRLAQIVREETGNSVLEKNFPMLESRIRSHLLKFGFSGMQDYWAYFQKNEPSEREFLQSLMTTHHTFFFREYLHFEAVEKWIQDEIEFIKERFQNRKIPVRVWSAACSRGQEVYSLAMFLDFHLFQKFGIPYKIYGTDIDQESISHAQNGVYSLQEVNSIPKIYLNRFWKKGTGPIKEFAAVHPKLKINTHFETHNLLNLNKWDLSHPDPFDIIFCRNVFIYFTEDKVKSIALHLAQRVSPRGLLISGASEPLRFSDWPMTNVSPSCYQKIDPSKETSSSSIVFQSFEKKSTTKGSLIPQTSDPKYRVLCVDDSPTIQMLLSKIFSSDSNCLGVDLAGNGNEARQKLNLQHYDVMTLDIHMPEVNGIEFLEKLYSKQKDPPVIMISSVNRTYLDLSNKAIALGAFDYVEKPALNNLQKVSSEILVKTKMALRNKQSSDSININNFDASIGQKIIVPDASQCLRIIVASEKNLTSLEQILSGQKNEYRSPATLILWRQSSQLTSPIENKILDWYKGKVVEIRDPKQFLKPNVIYIDKNEFHKEIFKNLKVSSVSLQLLDLSKIEFIPWSSLSSLQILLDEKLTTQSSLVKELYHHEISDITPATSFPSLSVEFFAHLRKSVA
ncbi:MAG: response regulator [Bdellovibrionales bacterium]|nr:response regulator [Bdellovibrionales bacterium]